MHATHIYVVRSQNEKNKIGRKSSHRKCNNSSKESMARKLSMIKIVIA